MENLTFKTLNQEHSGDLTKSFCVEEVKQAMENCDSSKSLGPGGVNFGFIKDFWAELNSDFMRFISKFHRNEKLITGINNTCIALIPKVESHQGLSDFRPLSLVGSLYKMLAKVLSN